MSEEVLDKTPGKNFLQTIAEVTSGLMGHDLLLETAKQITIHLGMKYCFVAECANDDKTRLRTVVFVDGENVLDNIEYNTNESGCQMMMNGDTFFLPAGAQQRFSGAKGIEAYVGAPIMSPVTGEVLGHIAATHPKPVTNEKDQTGQNSHFRSVCGRCMAKHRSWNGYGGLYRKRIAGQGNQ